MKQKRKNLLWATLVLSASTSAFAGHPKTSPDLDKIAGSETVNVIVQYKHAPTAANQLGIMGPNGTVKGTFKSFPALAATVSGSMVHQLANDPEVAYISLDRPLSRMTADYSAESIYAPQAWAAGYDGTGVGVVVIDSGIVAGGAAKDLTPSNQTAWNTLAASMGFGKGPFPSRVMYSESFLPTDTDSTDGYGHGSHVAGLIAGNGANSTGNQYSRTLKGVAPGAYLVNLRVLDANGQGSDSSVIAAIERAIQLKQAYPSANLRVINLSLGRGVFESYKQDPRAKRLNRHIGLDSSSLWRRVTTVAIRA